MTTRGKRPEKEGGAKGAANDAPPKKELSPPESAMARFRKAAKTALDVSPETVRQLEKRRKRQK